MRTIQRFVTAAPPGTVWKILADVERWHAWTPTVLQIAPITSDGLHPGARYRVTQPKLRPAVYEVTECTPEDGFTWIQKLPGGFLAAGHRIAPVEGGTEVELSFQSIGLFPGVVSWMFSKRIREYVATEAKCLKQRCESV
jgi:hypothetical protein